VLLAIAPATQLEALVASAYGVDPSSDVEVNLETGPIAIIDDEAFRLVDLDDDRVSKMTQQISLEATIRRIPSAMPSRVAPPAPPPEEPTQPPVRSSTPAVRISTPPPTVHAPQARPVALDYTLKALEHTTTRDEATSVAMTFVESRFPASLLLAIKEGAALGHRGHGPAISGDALQTLAIPLTAPSSVKLAHDSRRVATDTPPGAGVLQERLERLVGHGPLAAPVFLGSHVACVMVVGADPADALAGAELERLATALGVAYTRIVLDAKKS